MLKKLKAKKKKYGEFIIYNYYLILGLENHGDNL